MGTHGNNYFIKSPKEMTHLRKSPLFLYIYQKVKPWGDKEEVLLSSVLRDRI
jgi:hypothetical protein